MTADDVWAQTQYLSDPGVVLATITHPTFGVLRFANAPVDLPAIVSRGQSFVCLPFISDGINDDDGLPRSNFQLPNIEHEMGVIFDKLIDPAEVTLEVIALSRPDTPIKRYPRLQLRQVKPDQIKVTGTLYGRDLTNEPLGTYTVNPVDFPALFLK